MLQLYFPHDDAADHCVLAERTDGGWTLHFDGSGENVREGCPTVLFHQVYTAEPPRPLAWIGDDAGQSRGAGPSGRGAGPGGSGDGLRGEVGQGDAAVTDGDTGGAVEAGSGVDAGKDGDSATPPVDLNQLVTDGTHELRFCDNIQQLQDLADAATAADAAAAPGSPGRSGSVGRAESPGGSERGHGEEDGNSTEALGLVVLDPANCRIGTAGDLSPFTKTSSFPVVVAVPKRDEARPG
ncbi:hypothetical protein [Corynebacterium heidelbergense]|uniref:Uncharacterized protein n=1 Tax=Corynebacterium heidelbergense TaxID=2055947 RepID=A0A364VCX6_9CORY|nr:hypothetical protein [Corynebacterium heidelbergense]RAV34509.1 hypothetical protein CWC39_03000 [Corynebacterium heidelbergense]WCZ36160.1 hypothetical protein CHEID_03000 [Corynebacterium heidelbergense]